MTQANNSPLQQVEIQAWSDELLQNLRPLAAKKEISIISEIDSRIRDVAMEKDQLTHLVHALIGSAILTSPSGSMVGLEITGDLRHDTVHMTIWDSGPGIQSYDVMRLFMGENLDGFQEEVFKSLPELVFQHEGLMTVNNSSGYGTRVTLSLPWQEPLLQMGQKRPAKGSGHILLVDDDELNIFTVASYLKSMGFKVSTAYNGREGLDKLLNNRPDLVLMDVNMPIMNGLDAIRHIRGLSERELSQVPVIAFSAYSMSSDEHDCLAAGANEFISKPVSMRWLRQKVHQYLPSLAN